MIVATFLVNLLCSMVPCDHRFNEPEISVVDNALRPSRSALSNKTVEPFAFPILAPIVQTNVGKVEGFLMKSSNGMAIFAFEGIPYAEAPSGLKRFQPPVPKSPWSFIRQANKRGHACLQISPTKIYRTFGREDCLTVNVYTSNVKKTLPKLPVIIWIHGGAYAFGEGADYGPSYLLNEDVVLVSFNYRLGILGFLSTGDEVSPGNNGLKDQALAIKWVHDNIANFGGNPAKVTLMGHSAGGASTHIHMMSNKTSKYFRSAISLSGTAMNYWGLSTARLARKYLNKIARNVKCPTLAASNTLNSTSAADSLRTVQCLRSRNPNTLVSSQFKLLEWGPFPIVTFAPVVETPNPTAIIEDTPDAIYERGGVAKIPWIASYTKEEGLFQLLLAYGLLKVPELMSQWEKSAPFALDFAHVQNSEDIARKVKEFYFGDKPLKSFSYARLSDPMTDRFSVNDIHKAIIKHSTVAPTYGYMFDFLGSYNLGNYLGIEASDWGIGHTEDVTYLFNSSTLYNGFSKTDLNELAISKLMVNLLVNFAAKNEPLYTDQRLGEDQTIWTQVNPKDPQFLNIGMDTKMIPEPFKERRQFWESLALNEELETD